MNQMCTIRAVSAVAGLAIGISSAFAQTDVNWLDPVSGVWSDTANWSGEAVPNGTDFNAIIAATGGIYTVSLDLDVTLNGFELSWGGATLDLLEQSLTTADAFLLRGGSITSSAPSLAGSLSLSGSSTIDGGTIQSLAAVMVTQGSALDIQGSSSFSDTMLMTSGGTLLFTSDDDTDLDDTCVDSLDGGSIFLSGGGNINFTNGGGFHVDATSSLVIEEGGDRAIQGITEGEMINNEGLFVKKGAAPLPGRSPEPGAGGDLIVIQDLDFFNSGTVRNEGGELFFAENTSIIAGTGGVLDGGTWEIVNDSIITLENQSIFTIGSGAHVLVDGEFSLFEALNPLNSIEQEGSLTISGGKDFTTGNGIGVQGLLRVGEGSTFDTQSGLFNVDGDTIFGGEFEIAGELIVDEFSADITELAGASVTLIGVDSAVLAILDEPVDALAGLDTIRSGGTFAVTDGRSFTTVGDLAVGLAGDNAQSTLRVGEGSQLDVTGMLTNFGTSGDFVDGIFDIAGTLTATNAQIKTIFNDVTLDGVASNILDDGGNDAFSFLERIAHSGILRLLNGRTLEGLGDIIVDGTLIIDPGTGGGGEASDAILSTTGDFFVSASAVIEFVLNDPAQLPGIAADGGIDFGRAGSAGAIVLSLGDAYSARVGDEFVLIEGLMLGEFAAVQGLDLGNGLALELNYTSLGLSVSVTPTPATIALLSLGGLAGIRRRR